MLMGWYGDGFVDPFKRRALLTENEENRDKIIPRKMCNSSVIRLISLVYPYHCLKIKYKFNRCIKTLAE